MIRYFIFLVGLLLFTIQSTAQVKVGDNSSTIHPSAVLEIESTNKALLLPRMTTAQRNAIASPALGLVIFNTNTNCLNWWTGTQWYNNCDGSTPETGTNTAPVVNAGTDQNITLPVSTVTLVGTSTDSDGVIVSNAWTQLSGPVTAAMAQASNTSTSVTGLTVAGVYVFQLTATDDDSDATSDTVAVYVTVSNNQAPIANAGVDQTIALPTNYVTLSASGSNDPDGTIVNYVWTQLSGPNTATMQSANTVQTIVENMIAGTYVFQITVRDNGNVESTDTVTIIVNNANANPVSVPGPTQALLVGASVTLNGSGSYDSDGTIVTYLWTQASGPVVTIDTPNQAITNVTGVIAGNYAFTLKVTDNMGAFHSTNILVNVNTGAAMTTPFGDNAVAFSTNTTCSNNIISTSSCNGETSITAPSGNVYALVEINGQCWFKQNIKEIPSNFNPVPVNTSNVDDGWSGFYSNTEQFTLGVSEGRLYDWKAVMNNSTLERTQGVCPPGWHIPSDCEVMYLEHGIGLTVAQQNAVNFRGTTQGNLLKVGGSTGFDLPNSGYGDWNTGFSQRGIYGFFWTSTDSNRRALGTPSSAIHRGTSGAGFAFAARCLKD